MSRRGALALGSAVLAAAGLAAWLLWLPVPEGMAPEPAGPRVDAVPGDDPSPAPAANATVVLPRDDEAPRNPECPDIVAALRQRLAGTPMTDADVDQLTACAWALQAGPQVEQLLKAAQARQPQNVQVLEDLSGLYRSQGRFPEALELLERANAAEESADVRALLAITRRHYVLAQEQQLPEGEADRLRALAEIDLLRLGELDPGRADLAFEQAALSMLDRGDYVNGAYTLERALNAQQPGSEGKRGYLYMRLGEAWIRAGQPQAGLAHLDAAESYPEVQEYGPQLRELRAEAQAALNR